MTPIIKNNYNYKFITLTKIQVIFIILVITGNNTIAATLIEIINMLVQNPLALQKLVAEVCEIFLGKKRILSLRQ